MSEKYLRIEMPDKSEWDVPAQFIAEDRARNMATSDTGAEAGDAEWDRVYVEEVAFTLSENYEIKDWAANNMNWEDVAHVAVQAKSPPEAVDYQEGWCNGEKRVVEK